MQFYQFHIGDYVGATAHLDPMEDLAYRRLIDLYYQTECALPNDMRTLCKRIRLASESHSVESVLNEFFELSEDGQFWQHQRCDAELEEIYSKSQKARESAQKRWKKPQSQCDGNANAMRTHNERIQGASISHTKSQCDGNANAMRTHNERIQGASISHTKSQCDGNATHNPLPNTHNPIKTSTNTHHTDSKSIAPEQSSVACDLVLSDSQISDLTTAICISLKSEGASMTGINRADPRIKALLLKGATVDMFVGAYREAMDKSVKHPFPYSLSIVEGRITEAHDISAKARASPTASNKQVALEQRNMDAVREALAEDGIV